MLHLTGAAHLSFRSFGHERLSRLWESLGFGPAPASLLQLFDTLLSPWGERLIGDAPGWPSDVTDDSTPFEFSVALDGEQPELRILVEAQGSPTTLESSWAAGLELNQRLEREYGLSLERFRLIESLFAPQDPNARFSLWHAACVRPGQAPDFKAYLNPAARGPEHSSALVRDALQRLGFESAWAFLANHVLRRPGRDRVIYFSLDLAGGPRARVKIYIAHEGATAAELERVAATGPAYEPNDAAWFCRGLSGSEGPFLGRAPITCFAFTSDSDHRPSAVTLLLPVRAYASDDRESLRFTSSLLAPADRPVLHRAVEAAARRPLEAGLGLQSWVSFRRQHGRRRFTVYLAPEAYAMLSPRREALPALYEPPQGAQPRISLS